MALTRGQIARRTVRSLLYQGAGQYAALGIGVIKGMLLARLVVPAVFGQVALGLSSVSFLNLFKMYLREGVTRDTNNNPVRLFTLYAIEVLSALPGFVLAGALYLITPGLFSLPVWIVIAVALVVHLISALASVPQYLLERDLRYDVLARLTLYGTIISLLVSVPLAAAGQPLTAILLDQVVVIPLLTAAGAVIAARWRPRIAWDAAAARENMGLAATLWVNGLFSKVTFEFDDLLVGKIRGEGPLGYYAKAYTPLAKLPLDVAGGMIASVALGVYGQSRAAGREVLARAYSLMTWLLARVIALSSIVLLAATEEITLILYGADWLAVVPLVRLMALYVIGRPFWQNDAQVLISVGQERRVRTLQGLQALLLVVLGTPAVLLWGAEGASLAVSVMMIVGMAVTAIFTARTLGVRLAPLYALPGLLVLLLSPLLWSFGLLVPLPAVPGFLVKGALAAALGGGAILLFEGERVKEAVALLMDNLSGGDSPAPGSDSAP